MNVVVTNTPRTDLKLVDALGRKWQLSTVQFDFTLPKKFGLEYVAEDGKKHQPLMVHRALYGSVERFFGILIEHYAGAFPLWLAPVQTVVMPITDRQLEYAQKVQAQLEAAGIRSHLDDRKEKVNLKIRDAQLQKVPYMLVVGDREAEAGAVAVRHRKQGDQGAKPLDQFIDAESKEYHATVLDYLTALEIPYVENPTLVRGLDYYNQTVFEYWDSSTGAQNAVGGGGRYDSLIELLGGKQTPGLGAACGMERIIWHMKEAGVKAPNKDKIDVFVAQLGPEAKKTCLQLITQLRDMGVHTLGALGEASLKSQMRLADKFEAKYTLLLGKMEVKNGTIILRDMQAGKQKEIKFADTLPTIKKLLGEKNLDTYSITDKLGNFVEAGE